MHSFIVNSVVFLLLATASCQAANDNQSILIIGDSLSAAYGIEEDQSWVVLLGNRLTAEDYGYRVINASIGGDTTGGGLRRLPRALKQHEPGIVLIELGGNDGLRGIPIHVIRSNLASMIETCQAAGARVLLAGMQMPPNYGTVYAGDFSRIYPDLTDEYEVALIGFFLEDVALDPGLMQNDGIHPNAEAQPQLLNNVWPVLERLLEE